MKFPRTAQEWIHWLEMGEGARWVRLAAVLVGGLALSLGLVVGGVAGRPAQHHAHDVARIARVQLLLGGRGDDVVGRGHDLGEIAFEVDLH